MIHPNLHELVSKYQLVYWNEFNSRDIIELELIDYFSAISCQKGRMLYMGYYAVILHDYEKLGLKAGQEITIYIAYYALLSALNKLRGEYKVPCLKKFAEGKNLYIKLEKQNPKAIAVHYAETRESTAAQLEEAKRIYKMMRQEHDRSQFGNQ